MNYFRQILTTLRTDYKILDTDKILLEISKSLKKEKINKELNLSLLKHITVYLHYDFTINGMSKSLIFKDIKYSKVISYDRLVGRGVGIPAKKINGYYITTNLYSIIENKLIEDLKSCNNNLIDYKFYDKRVTIILKYDKDFIELISNIDFLITIVFDKIIITGYISDYEKLFKLNNKKYLDLINLIKLDFSKNKIENNEI